MATLIAMSRPWLLIPLVASQTADVEDSAGGRHGTDDDADGADAGAGGRVRGGHGADGGGADGTGTTPVPVPLLFLPLVV